MAEFETRTVTAEIEFRDDSNGPAIVGHAATFDRPYQVGFFNEQIHRDAFKRTLSASPDVRLLINHDGIPLARTKSGTLTLGTDSTGLTVDARDLDMANPKVAEVASALKRGDVDQMSFAFRVPSGGDAWDYSSDSPLRTVREASLSGGDVSIVTYPANENASVALRGKETLDGHYTLATALLDDMREGRSVDRKLLNTVLRALSLREVGDSFNDTQQALRDALQAKYGSDDDSFDMYVQDAGVDWVVWNFYGDAGPGKGTWRAAYTTTDGSVTITGDPVQVNQETTYTPVQQNSQEPAGIPSDLALRLSQASALRRTA